MSYLWSKMNLGLFLLVIFRGAFADKKNELCAKIVHGFQPLTIFGKSSILDVWMGSKYPLLLIIFLFRRRRSQMFFKIGVLRNFAILTHENACFGVFFNKAASVKVWRPATLLNKTPAQLFSREYCEIYKKSFFKRKHLRWLLLSLSTSTSLIFLLVSVVTTDLFKLGSHRGDKLHCPSSSPEINVVGTIKVSSFNLHRQRWVERWISKSSDFRRSSSSPNHVSFLFTSEMM